MSLGINIIGMPLGMHGLGQELRDKALALVSEGVDVCVIDCNYSSLKSTVRDPRIERLIRRKPVHDINLICHNLPATGLMSRQRPELLEGRYNIGAPYWEFSEMPDTHLNGLEKLDEVWVSNSFLGDCFRPYTESPITQLPLHLDTNLGGQKAKPKGRRTKKKVRNEVVFGYVFDFNSMAARKNPLLLLLAFLEYFSDKPDEKVKLVLKYKYEPSHLVTPREVQDVIDLAELDPRIELIGEPLSALEMSELLDGFDVYISPHRAEGLGRGIIESMIRGKAVAATAYSGPAEFLSSDHSVPLDYYLSHVGSAALGDIKSHFSWADVHLESVIEAFKTFSETPNVANDFGKKGQKYIKASHGMKAHGQACKKRLLELQVL